MDIKVSVIIPTYNRGEHILNSVYSVLNQSYKNIELIIVDDNSSDNTEELINEIDDDRIKYICHETNKGASAARNTGINASSGSIVGFQDSDDLWLPQKLEVQLESMWKNNSDVVFCSYVRWNGEKIDLRPESSKNLQDVDTRKNLHTGNFIGTPTILAKKESLLKINGFDDTLPRFQDWDLCLRLSEFASFTFVREPLLMVYTPGVRISNSNTSGPKAMEIILEKNKKSFSQYPQAYSDNLFYTSRLFWKVNEKTKARTYIKKSVSVKPKILNVCFYITSLIMFGLMRKMLIYQEKRNA